MSGGNSQQAAAAADRFAAAHRALIADGSVQFEMHPAVPPAPAPAWLRILGEWLDAVFRPVGRLFGWLFSLMPDAPYARIILWGVIAVAAGLLAWMIVERVRHGAWRLPRRRTRPAVVDIAEEDWAPDFAPVHAWLREADRLAAEGLYAEAAHHLLFRSVEDIERRRPRIVRPSRTSRELVEEAAIPPVARDLFGRIVTLVERSLFGGRPVDRDEWIAARAAYAEMALPRAWAA